MPFEFVSNGKHGSAPFMNLLKFDGKLEKKLETLRHEAYMRWHPRGERIAGDPMYAIDDSLVDPDHVMKSIRLKKVPQKPLDHFGGITCYRFISDALYQVVVALPHDKIQFFPIDLVHDDGVLKYWIWRCIDLTNCTDQKRSGFIETPNGYGGTYWAKPVERQQVYMKRDCVGERHLWHDMGCGGLVVSDELGEKIRPFIDRGVKLEKIEWV